MKEEQHAVFEQLRDRIIDRTRAESFAARAKCSRQAARIIAYASEAAELEGRNIEEVIEACVFRLLLERLAP